MSLPNPSYSEGGAMETKMSQVTRLAFEGGGAHVACSLGVLGRLDAAGRSGQFTSAAGASAGALLAACVGMGADSHKIQRILTGYDWGKIDRPSRLLRRLTPWRVHPLEDLARYVIGSCGYAEDLTFGELMEEREFFLIISVSDELHCRPLRLSYSYQPNVGIREALIASMSVPYVFPAAKLTGIEGRFSDGGLSDNFPIDAYKACRSETVLGVRVDPPRRNGRTRRIPFGRAINLLQIVRGVADRAHVPGELWPRVVKVDEPSFSSLEFGEMRRNINECLNLGRLAVDRWEAKR